MDPSQALGWLKLPQRVLWALLVISGLVLWGPHWFISGLGLEQFIEAYRMYLGVAFLLFLAATLPAPIHWAASLLSRHLRSKRELQQLHARLHDLSPAEKLVLNYYLGRNTRTQSLDATDGVTTALEHAQIIYRSSNVSQEFTNFAYNIQQWALDYLRKHPELLRAG